MKLNGSAILVAILLSGWIFGGTAGLARISGRQPDYNNLLVHGLLKGHLYLDQDVPAALLALKNPYDPAQRAFGLGLHDASLFHGRYYIYFGPAPALLVMLPFAALTGNDLPVSYAVAIFVLAGSAALMAIFWHYLKIHEPQSSGRVVTAACLLALGTCGGQLILLSRHTMYELAVAGGAGFFLWSLYCLLRGWSALPPTRLSDRKSAPNATRSPLWCALSGLLLGLAVASRPIYLFCAVLLLLPLLRPSGRRPFLFSAASFAAVVGALLLYNYARFGQFSEFGQNYQLSGAIEGQVRHFSIHNLWFNLRVYFLSALRWGRYFPFVHPIEVPPLPPGFGAYEEAFGLLPNFPFYLLTGVGLAFGLTGLRSVGQFRAQIDLIAISVAAGILTGVMLLFFGSVVRYEADFCGPLLLLAACGTLSLDGLLQRPVLRRIYSSVVLAASVFSAIVAALTGITLYHDFARASPQQYSWLSRKLDYPALGLEKLGLLSPPGPRLLRMHLPAAAGGRRDLIVAAGWSPEADAIWARYPRQGYVQFQWVHGGLGVLAASPEYALGANKLHELTIQTGSFYPPDDAPFFASLSPEEIGRDRTCLAVTLDQQPPWRLTGGFFESSPGTLQFGPAVAATQLTAPTPAPYHLPSPRVELDLTIQPEWAGRTFPLVTRGRSFAGDTIYLSVIDRSSIRLGYDHWGRPPLTSPPIPWVMGWPQKLTIELPAASASAETAIVVFKGAQTIWQPELSFYPARAHEIYPATNLIGSTVCEQFWPTPQAAVPSLSESIGRK